jgi:hypothetical protein
MQSCLVINSKFVKTTCLLFPLFVTEALIYFIILSGFLIIHFNVR